MVSAHGDYLGALDPVHDQTPDVRYFVVSRVLHQRHHVQAQGRHDFHRNAAMNVIGTPSAELSAGRSRPLRAGLGAGRWRGGGGNCRPPPRPRSGPSARG